MKNAEDILKAKSIRITPMRQLVLEYMLNGNKAVGLSVLENDFPKSDRITMYRTLRTFVEKGILHSIENGTSEIKYALCKEHCSVLQHLDQHPHFHCLRCSEITCLESIFIPTLKLPDGYFEQTVNMTYKGICKDCS